MPALAWISLAACQDRRLYLLISRNLALGVFKAETNGFLGLREKFGRVYVFEEYHWDQGPPFGTAKPMEVLPEHLPEHIPLVPWSESPAKSHLVNNHERHLWLQEMDERYKEEVQVLRPDP